VKSRRDWRASRDDRRVGAGFGLPCGDDDSVGGGDTQEVQVAQGGQPSGEVLISDWPGYVDPGANGTIAQFEQQTGVETDYKDDVSDNVIFFNKLKPQLDQGSSGGRSLFVVTDWMAKRMYDLGYLQEINHETSRPCSTTSSRSSRNRRRTPSASSRSPGRVARPDLRRHQPGPGDRFGLDLFDPKYKGKVTMLTEMRDTVPLILQSEGIRRTRRRRRTGSRRSTSSARRATRADPPLHGQRVHRGPDQRQHRRRDRLVGDSTLIGREGVEWRRPTDGCDLFFDQAVIPIGAPNTPAALAFLNFVYTPENAADITEYVQYVSPNAGVQEILAQRDPKLAKDPLIFPAEEDIAECSEDPDPPGSAEDVAEVDGGVPGGGLGLKHGRRRRRTDQMKKSERSAVGLRRRLIPYGLLAPGAIWLILFFVIPMYFMAEMSLRSGVPNTPEGFTFSWEFSNYTGALEGRGEQIVRTFYYAGAATILALLIAYPLAYAIALKVNLAGACRSCSP
jgi:spermidine/putrescine transport system substrate-binding protein